jgi:anti-sigma-K factor RskA
MKNCSDWEQEIAGELESAQLVEHLEACERCREFAEEIEKNRAALGELTIDAAAFTAVRQRVLSEIQAKKQRIFWWRWVAAACAVMVLVMYFTQRPRDFASPAPLVARIDPPQGWELKPVRHTTSGRHLGKPRPVQKTEPIVAVKMLTDDPNVIIIWLVDQKGDSL